MNKKIIKIATTHQNMHKICKIKNMQKEFMKIFACFILFLETLDHQHYFKPNLYFYVIYANMQIPGSSHNLIYEYEA